MEQSTHTARLKYLDADDVDDAVVDFDGLNVYSADGHKVGDIEGFVIDATARRVNYIVVDSGGWFTSRHFLLPIGHAALAPDKKSLQTDVAHDALRRLPSFDHDRFDQLNEEELFAFERDTAIACCPEEPLETVAAPSSDPDSLRHFRQPDWWSAARYTPERLRPINRDAFTPVAQATPVSSSTSPKARDEYSRERVTARETDDQTTAGDVSPHLDGRAQPGDVLGIETGGETTAIGDTDEDENKRRQAAERGAADDRTEKKRGKR